MTRGRPRWGHREARQTFPLPSERKAEPRFDGAYGDEAAGRVRFGADGTVRWNEDVGEWRVHADVLRLRTATRDCEGAISGEAVHLLCADGNAREQLVLRFVGDVER